jgi:hypothetical protein
LPLVKTADRFRGNADVLEYDLWPHSRSKLIDDCWILALSHLPRLKKYEQLVNEKADLTGRSLEPWRALLAVAAWLEHCGVKDLWKRIHQTSLGYQGERQEIESTDLTPLVIMAVQKCLEDKADVLTFSDVSPDTTPHFIQTKFITEAAQHIAEQEELGIDLDKITGRRIGWILKRLRFPHRREGKAGNKGWLVSRVDLQKYFIAFNLFPSEKTSETSETSASSTNEGAERFTV